MSDLFHPITAVLAVSIALAFLSVQMKTRRRMMGTKLGADVLYGVYLTAIGGLSGGLASFIASCGSLTQVLTPEHKLASTLRLRILLAVMLSLAAILVSVRTLGDLLPILAVVFCRFVEIQKDPQRIRYGFFLSAFPWMIYNYSNGFYWPMLYNIVIASSLMIAIIRHRNPATPMDPA
jgi:hypothetical protein